MNNDVFCRLVFKKEPVMNKPIERTIVVVKPEGLMDLCEILDEVTDIGDIVAYDAISPV